MSAPSLPIAVEIGPRHCFAIALDWPGWCRRGKGGEEAGIEALLGYAERYRVVVERAGLPWPQDFVPDIVERLPGGGGTDFGAPFVPAAAESLPLTAAEAERRAALLAASWAVFDEIAAAAPEELRKGPRGGGRDTSKVWDHVIECDRGYARQLGVRHPPFDLRDRDAIASLRSDMLDVLRQAATGERYSKKGWTPRFAARYITWHVLDHAWEIVDRST
jgi:hypothetical protein